MRGKEVETKASRSRWFGKGEREGNSNDNTAIILKYRVNEYKFRFWGESGQKN